MSAEELAELVGKLDEMASIKEDLEMMEATLGAIEATVDWLGEGELMGGGVSPWKPGYSRELGSGTGGPGRGYGAFPIDDTGPTAMQKTRVKSKSRRGPIVASWYFKGSQVKGESRREFDEVMQVGKDRAADAVSDDQIPRKYETPLKKYFGEFGQTIESEESRESKEK